MTNHEVGQNWRGKINDKYNMHMSKSRAWPQELTQRGFYKVFEANIIIWLS